MATLVSPWQRVGRDDRLAHANLEFGMGDRFEEAGEDEENQQLVSEHYEFLPEIIL
jgi:hypothetical protein